MIVDGLSLGALSNSSGYYAIRDIPPGNHVIAFSHIGYETHRDTLNFIDDGEVRLDIALFTETILIDEETVVVGERREDDRAPQTSFVELQIENIQQLPAVGEPDLLRSLQLLPGIQTASDISSGLYIRGGGPDQNLILLDQVPLYNPSHAFGFFSTFNPDQQLDLDESPFLLSLYAEDTWQPDILTTLRLGVRASYFSEGGRLAVMPRVGFNRILTPSLRIKASGGTYRQYMQLVTTEGFSGGDFWVPLDRTVEPGRSYQGVLGLEWEPSRRYKFTIEGYYSDLINLVVLDSDVAADSEGNRSADIFKTDGTGYATGAELFLEKRTGKLRGWIGYTLGWTRRQFAELNQGRSFSPKYDRRHDLSLVLTYQRARWTWGSSFVYGTGQAFTPAAARYTLRSPATGIVDDYVLPAARNSARLLPYHRLDLSLRRALSLWGSDAEFYLQIFNAYSRRNEWFVQYDTDNPDTQPEVVQMLPIVPTFGINFSF